MLCELCTFVQKISSRIKSKTSNLYLKIPCLVFNVKYSSRTGWEGEKGVNCILERLKMKVHNLQHTCTNKSNKWIQVIRTKEFWQDPQTFEGDVGKHWLKYPRRTLLCCSTYLLCQPQQILKDYIPEGLVFLASTLAETLSSPMSWQRQELWSRLWIVNILQSVALAQTAWDFSCQVHCHQTVQVVALFLYILMEMLKKQIMIYLFSLIFSRNACFTQ